MNGSFCYYHLMAPKPRNSGKLTTPVDDNPAEAWTPREGFVTALVDPLGELVFSYEDNPDIILRGPPNETQVEAWRRGNANQEHYIALVEDHNQAVELMMAERERVAEEMRIAERQRLAELERIAEQNAEGMKSGREAVTRGRTTSNVAVRPYLLTPD
jgi:hypothetical protein